MDTLSGLSLLTMIFAPNHLNFINIGERKININSTIIINVTSTFISVQINKASMNKFIFLLVYLESKSYSLLLYGLIIGITFSYSLILLSDISNLISLICGLLFIFITIVISWRTYSLYLLKTKISRKSINRAKLDLVKYNRQKKMTKLVLIKMNRSLKIIIFIFFNFMGYVYGQIDSVTYHMQELLPNRKVIRYPSLDKAARLHAEYMVTQKKNMPFAS